MDPVPAELNATDTDHGDKGAEEHETGDGEDGDLHGAEAARPLVLAEDDLPDPESLEGLQGQFVPEFLSGHHGVSGHSIDPELRHLSDGSEAAGGDEDAAEVGEDGGEVLELSLNDVLGLVDQDMELQVRVQHRYLG